MSWSTDINKLVTKGKRDLGDLAAVIKIEVFSDVVKNTRVDTGRLRGNWQISEGRPATGTVDTENQSPSGVIPADLKAAIVSGSTPDGKTYMTNNLPYAKVYENKDAMVGRAVASIKQRVKVLASKIK